MLRTLNLRARFAACASALAATISLGVASAQAQDGADFYKGKTITIVVGIEQGTGFDLYGRASPATWAGTFPAIRRSSYRTCPARAA